MAFINTNLRHVGTVGQGDRCVLPGVAHGYVCAGYMGKFPDDTHGTAIYGTAIQKFSLTTDGNATNVADILSARRGPDGCSSETHGFVVGGGLDSPGTHLNSIERFHFATDSDSADWADMTETKRTYGNACSSATHGFTLGGTDETGTTKVIDKFPFASQTNATAWADATTEKSGGAAFSSPTHGYSSGGSEASIIVNVIERFPFASQVDSVDVADLTLARGAAAGISSCEDGYAAGGVTVGTNPANSAPLWDRTVIDKHSFASGGNSTDHGDLPVELGAGAHSQAGVSGTTHGYSVGGIFSRNIHNHQWPREQIEKFAYANNVTATDVGDLQQAGSANPTGTNWGMDNSSGHQV